MSAEPASTLCGVPVDPAGQIAPERLAAVTEGRRKVPLRQMTEFDFSMAGDIYIAVVVIARKGEFTVRVSDMVFNNSTEMDIVFEDPEGGSPEKLVGKVVLILNPRFPNRKKTSSKYLHVASVKSCLIMGTLTGVGKCSHEDCTKTILPSRDGAMCHMHAVLSGVIRVCAGGDLKETEAVTKVFSKPKPAQPVSAEEQTKLQDDRKRADILAKKKTALMLLNRRSSTGGHLLPLSGQIEIGEIVDDGHQKERIQRIDELKRKREKIEKADTALVATRGL